MKRLLSTRFLAFLRFFLLALLAWVIRSSGLGVGLDRLSCGDDLYPILKASRLLTTLPESCPTPDGMALASNGNIILACPNYADLSHPAVLMEIEPSGEARLWCRAPVHPKTGVGCPMGIAFGPDGDLFVADNQGWRKPNQWGRVLRLKVRDGKVQRMTVVAHGLSHPNGVRIHQGHIYVTHSLLVQEEGKPLISGVYRFRLDDEGVQVNNRLDDKNLIATIETFNADVQYGADGLVFDDQGNLYVANFGDATIHKIVFDNNNGDDGEVVSNSRFAKDDRMKSADGICVDEKNNLYVADFSNNAIFTVSPEGKVRLLARSPDCDGSLGGLDQPAELIVRGRKLIASNFDLVTGPDKLNQRHDVPHTLSVIDLGE